MEKKDLKFYDAPVVELVEVELEGHLLDASMPEVDNESEDEEL